VSTAWSSILPLGATRAPAPAAYGGGGGAARRPSGDVIPASQPSRYVAQSFFIIGSITGLARRSVRLFVRQSVPYRLLTRKQIGVEKPKSVEMFPRVMSNRCASFQLERSKIRNMVRVGQL